MQRPSTSTHSKIKQSLMCSWYRFRLVSFFPRSMAKDVNPRGRDDPLLLRRELHRQRQRQRRERGHICAPDAERCCSIDSIVAGVVNSQVATLASKPLLSTASSPQQPHQDDGMPSRIANACGYAAATSSDATSDRVIADGATEIGTVWLFITWIALLSSATTYSKCSSEP